MTDRRAVLAGLAAAFLAACTRSAPDAAPTTATPPEPEPTTTTTTTSPPLESEPPAIEPTVEPIEPPAVDLPDGAFALGVASGEPDLDSVVLWARLIGGDLPERVPVVWEAATDESFATLLGTGLVEAEVELGHSLHVVATDLGPDRTIAYRFRAGGLTSPVGRARTLPNSGRPLRLGFSSCQSRSTGAWAAHRHAAEADLDAMVWLGDYIYGTPRTLAEYRATYVEYRSDPLLQDHHAAHPWICFIDDHEIVNDADASVDPQRRAAALQAWWEHMPTRLAPPLDGRLRVDRTFDLGAVARLVGLDVRQYADDRTLLGDDQWDDLSTAFDHAAPVTIVASPTVMSGLRGLDQEPLVPYSIDARPEERRRMADLLAAAPSPIIVSGDLHTSLVARFSADPLDPDAPAVATELMAPPISSAFPADLAPLAPFLTLTSPLVDDVTVANGWLELVVGADGWDATFHDVDDVSDPNSTVTDRSV